MGAIVTIDIVVLHCNQADIHNRIHLCHTICIPYQNIPHLQCNTHFQHIQLSMFVSIVHCPRLKLSLSIGYNYLSTDHNILSSGLNIFSSSLRYHKMWIHLDNFLHNHFDVHNNFTCMRNIFHCHLVLLNTCRTFGSGMNRWVEGKWKWRRSFMPNLYPRVICRTYWPPNWSSWIGWRHKSMWMMSKN